MVPPRTMMSYAMSCSPLTLRRYRLFAADDSAHPLEQRLGRVVKALDHLLHGLAGDRLNLDATLLRLGEERRVLAHFQDGLPNRRDAIFRRARGHEVGAGHLVFGDDGFEHPAIAPTGKAAGRERGCHGG